MGRDGLLNVTKKGGGKKTKEVSHLTNIIFERRLI
jgi:hypothetical protein